ncbi:MAG: hypothetical protein ABSA84_03195 [Gammaproteobacteria bacterium]
MPTTESVLNEQYKQQDFQSDAQNQDQVDRIKLLLIAAHNIAEQTEEKELDDTYIIFTIKQELLKQGIDENLATAITIIYGSSYFLENNESVPKQHHLEQAAEWLAKSEALIHYKANQASIVKFLQEYFSPNSSAEKAATAAAYLKQEIYSGNSIEGQLKYTGRIAELSWTAFVIAQDYGANYYFSPIDGAFKINRNNQGNGLYAAILPSIQAALKDDEDNPIHKLTVKQLSKNIRELLGKSKGIIVKQFSDIIRNNANVLSVPSVFAEELNLLKSSYQQRENLSAESQNILDQEIANYLEIISARYIEFVNSNPETGGDIELQIIAHYYNIHIKQHAHLSDDYNAINTDAKSIAHIFCGLHQGHYHNLEQQKDLAIKTQQSSTDYIEQAAFATNHGKLESYLETAIAILALHDPVIWQPSKQVNYELLEQKIHEATQKTKSIGVNSLKQHNEQLLKNKKPPAKQEAFKRDLTLSLIPSEQLKIVDQEAAVGMANIELIAADHKLKLIDPEQDKNKFIAAKQTLSVKREQYLNSKMVLHRAHQTVHENKYARGLIAYHNTVFIMELKALGVANLQAYRAWWQNIIAEQRNSIETTFATVNNQIDTYLVELNKAYEQKLTEVDNHYAAVLNKCIQDYYYQQRCVTDAKRTAKRKRRQKMTRNFVGMAIASFVAPYLAGCMFPGAAAVGGAAATAGSAATAGTVASTAGFGCTVATGIIGGAISSAIAGNNVFKGAALGGLFSGFGFKVDEILGDFIKNSELLKESLSVAATASLSTAIYKGKLLDNILVSVGANTVAGLIVPTPKFAANKDLTKQQLNVINNRQVMRAFTRSMTASVANKNSNFGMSLMMAGMGGLQTWIGHQANMYAEQRRIIQQQQNFQTKPTNTIGGRIGGYRVDFPGIEHPGARAFLPSSSRKLPRREEHYGAAGSSQSVAVPQPQPNFTVKFGNAALDFLMPAAYGDEFVTIGVTNHLEEGLLNSLLIGSGRSFVNVGQGIKQGCCIVGEKIGLVQPGTSDRYTQQINRDKHLYSNTPVAQSVSGKVGEFGTDMLLYSVVPAGAGVRGWRLAASSAAAGGFIGGLQPTDDGLLSTRFQNAGIGAVVGGIVGPLTGKAIDGVKGGMLKLFDVRKTSSMFNTTKQSSGLNWNFASRLAEQLQDPRLCSLAGKLDSRKILQLANNPKANFFLDKNTGHINVIQKVNGISGKSLRITVIRDEQKIISVGVVRDTSLLQYTSNSSRYIEIGVKKMSKQIKGP